MTIFWRAAKAKPQVDEDEARVLAEAADSIKMLEQIEAILALMDTETEARP
jgi:hypothetical protein